MKKIVVLGAGESGTGAAILAKEKGMEVFVSDMGEIAPMYQALLDQHQIAWEAGQHTPSLILDADEVIKSPGIPLTAPLVKQLMERGTPILSEIEFAARYTNANELPMFPAKPTSNPARRSMSKISEVVVVLPFEPVIQIILALV